MYIAPVSKSRYNKIRVERLYKSSIFSMIRLRMKHTTIPLFIKWLSKVLLKIRSRFSAHHHRYIQWGKSTPFRSTLYYVLFSDEFDNVHFRFLNGKFHFLNNPDSLGLYSKTRRNIHRLEKGIAANRLRQVDTFAADYIEETVDDFSTLATNGVDANFYKWGSDVLTAYFTIVADTEKIETLKEKFQSITASAIGECDTATASIPYAFAKLPPLTLTYDQFAALLHRRHSVRWYNEKVVSDEIITKAVSVALTSPSACNRQAFTVYCLKGDKLEEVKKLKLGFEIFAESIHTFLFIVGDLSAYIEERDKHLIYIDGGLFAMSLMLAFETMGVSTCPINFPDMAWLDTEMDRILGLKPYQKGVMLMSIGYADANSPVPFSAKKQVTEVLKFVN